LAATPDPAEVRDRIEALLGEDRPAPDAWIERLRAVGDCPAGPFATAVDVLLNLSMDDREAEILLRRILRHREDWTDRLGRDPGFAVAALDFGTTVAPLFRGAVAVERGTLDEAWARSTRDPRTGLLREVAFLERLRNETGRARRDGSTFALVLLEIDGFRAGVDRFGHRLGEAILRETAEVVQASCRGSDRAGRLAGGRFGVILPRADRAGAHALADRIRIEARRSLADRITQDHPWGHTVSGGIAMRPDDADTAEGLLERAESGLAAARAHGGDAISLYHHERRTSVRYPVRPAARVAVTTEDGIAAASTRAIDLSLHGALVEVESTLAIGERIHVYVKRRDADREAPGWSGFARVVRRVEREDGRRRLGVRFERPMPGDALRRFAWAEPGGVRTFHGSVS